MVMVGVPMLTVLLETVDFELAALLTPRNAAPATTATTAASTIHFEESIITRSPCGEPRHAFSIPTAFALP